jgi:hypothetical protein
MTHIYIKMNNITHSESDCKELITDPLVVQMLRYASGRTAKYKVSPGGKVFIYAKDIGRILRMDRAHMKLLVSGTEILILGGWMSAVSAVWMLVQRRLFANHTDQKTSYVPYINQIYRLMLKQSLTELPPEYLQYIEAEGDPLINTILYLEQEACRTIWLGERDVLPPIGLRQDREFTFENDNTIIERTNIFGTPQSPYPIYIPNPRFLT